VFSQTSRRTFLKLSTAAASGVAARLSHAMPTGGEIAVIIDSNSALTSTEPVRWAIEKLHETLAAKGISVSAGSGTFSIVVAGVNSPLAKMFGTVVGVDQPETTA
jgi:hypothetical protein